MWKEATRLALFEWKIEWFKRLFLQCLLTYGLLMFSFGMMEGVLDGGGIGLDYFYLAMFGLIYGWLVPRSFQYQKISAETYASPIFFMLHKLPIANHVLVRSRFIIFYLNAIPVLTLLFIGFTFIPELQQVLSTNGFVAFAAIWMSFGLSVGALFPASDLGDRGITNMKLVAITIGLIIAITLAILPSYIFYDDGIMNLSIEIANRWPFISIAIAVFTAIIANKLWINYAMSKMKQVDFDI
ncbi:hypothetical protein [Alkalibacillus salilacus]|uniref:Uncharacterized membrane protein YobD (UPF0266 family) n=1 Tax=Alkalibacillus salilacus TaxID=284582 RepID=A0ABT9VB96_9BACI|nr:hypothetical protein [Alkalibacillus salilacus]MDQ0158241.1 uncharacterized membrane protein YobD (UPF0266 family) [Alkalibacillus salilacus]